MTEQRERRKVQIESLLGTPLGRERLVEFYQTKCRPKGSNGVMATNPMTDARLRDMIEAILEAEFPPDSIEPEI